MRWLDLTLSCGAALASASQATLYMFPANHDMPPTLTAAESRQIYSEIFKVSRYHKLGFIGQQSKVIDSINAPSPADRSHDESGIDDGGEHRLFAAAVGSVVLNIAGVSDARHVFPDTTPLCHIDSSPRSDAYGDLMVRLLGQAEDLRGARLEKVYGNARGGGLYLSPPLKTVHEHVRHGPSMERFEKFYGPSIARHFDMKVVEDRGFISELSALESFVDAVGRAPFPLDHQYAAGHLVGLEILLNKYGAHSEQYSAGVKAYHQTLSTLYSRMVEASGPQQRLYVSLLPPTHAAQDAHLFPHAAGGDILKRWEENEMLFGDQHAAPSLESLTRSAGDGCFTSQEACEDGTDRCSGHGSCKKYMGQSDCYQCVCAPTQLENNATGGIKTTNWAGPTCAKKDVSVEFQIFFWFAVISIATLIWAVRLLASVEIGGGVLSATGYINKSGNAPAGGQ